MSDTEKGFVQKIQFRLKTDGFFKTIQYMANRQSIRKQQQLAEKEVISWNDHFFETLGVERSAAEQLLEATRKKIPLLDEDVHVKSQEQQSTHLLAFAALKVAGLSPKNILEIGTYLGFTTCLLSHLFPEAKIYTAALPSDDPVFDDYHILNGEDVEKVFEQRLARPNITVIKKNSGFLWEENLPDFDLIWLDGGHQYPVVAWDHFYSLSKLTSGGWLFSDDIVRPGEDKKSEDNPRFDAYHTVEYYSKRLENKFEYLLKREDAATYMYAKKFIAYLHKRN
jgi:predicted O-methyltransferase YrrM